jgi:23S rRNA (pseudouridine1915-N3)-methyltransferase
MRINIIAVGSKMPEWVNVAYQEFAKRFPREYKIKLIEIPQAKRSTLKNVQQLQEEEGLQIIKTVKSISQKSKTIALDVQGDSWTTEHFAKKLSMITEEGFAINFLIGGPDGLSETCLQMASYKLSLSRFTFPHPLVRVILIEQLYRIQSMLNNHPYHRG